MKGIVIGVAAVVLGAKNQQIRGARDMEAGPCCPIKEYSDKGI